MVNLILNPIPKMKKQEWRTYLLQRKSLKQKGLEHGAQNCMLMQKLWGSKLALFLFKTFNNINPILRTYRSEKKSFVNENYSKPLDTVVVRTPKTHLCLKDLLRLNKSVGMEAWFNSDLIDSYLNMALWSSTISLESNVFFVFDCFFYQRLPQPANFVFNSNILNGHSLGKSKFENKYVVRSEGM